MCLTPVELDETPPHFLHFLTVDLICAEGLHSCSVSIFTEMYSAVSIRFSCMENPKRFSEATPPPPLLPPLFAALESPKILQKVNKISIGSWKLPHMLFFRFKENVLFGRQLSFSLHWNSIFQIHRKSLLFIKAPRKTFGLSSFFWYKFRIWLILWLNFG